MSARVGRRAILGLTLWVAGAAGAAEPPRLVVLVVVDQMRPAGLDPALPGGLGRLAREGRVFADAALGHAGTETCAGHAAIATGRHAGPAGVPGNQFLDPATGRARECVNDPADEARVLGGSRGRSPRFLRVTGLADWLKQASPHSRVLALSPKDRAAIPLGGRRPDGVYWLDRVETLDFTTSRYYGDARPAWLVRFNGHGAADGFLEALPERWTHPTGAPANGARRDDHPRESPRHGRTSGHPVRGEDRRTTLGRLVFAPFLDAVTLDLARILVREERLGSDAEPDLLALSLSATDYVGHLYGPESQEARDARLRLDAWLGEFLVFLEARTGPGRLVVALTSDHGVLALPEWLAETGSSECPVRGGRVDARALGIDLARHLAGRFGVPEAGGAPWVLQAGFRLALNRPLATARGVAPDAVLAAAEAFLEDRPGVARVWTPGEIQAGAGPEPFATLQRLSYDAERSGDLVVEPARDCLVTPQPTGTSHGTPHLYDRAVPLVFWGDGIEAGIVRGAAGPVDVAPTLAARLGVTPPPGLDGRRLELSAAP